MKKLSKISLFLLIAAIMFLNVGCSSTTFNGEAGTEIISAKEALKMFNGEDVIIIDAQNSEAYSNKHVKNSVNISRKDIVINEPVTNVLGPKEQIEAALGKSGISNDSTVVIYDNNNNMDAARLWWTMKVYGHEKVKVVSGGLKALTDAGAEITKDVPNITATKYTAQDKNIDMIASIDDVKSQVNNPDENVKLVDTRSQEEFNEGTIPSSILMNYVDNNYNDGTYRSVQDIRIKYLEAGIKPENTAIMYCKTSIRGAQTYLALYNAGYRNLKLYDGAWVEWTKDSTLPIQKPSTTKIDSNEQDNS